MGRLKLGPAREFFCRITNLVSVFMSWAYDRGTVYRGMKNVTPNLLSAFSVVKLEKRIATRRAGQKKVHKNIAFQRLQITRAT
jgi:hypothetical protein